MAKALYEEQAVADIAAAIREKNKSEETYTVAEMAGAIRNIPKEERKIQSIDSVSVGICVTETIRDYVDIGDPETAS